MNDCVIANRSTARSALHSRMISGVIGDRPTVNRRSQQRSPVKRGRGKTASAVLVDERDRLPVPRRGTVSGYNLTLDVIASKSTAPALFYPERHSQSNHIVSLRTSVLQRVKQSQRLSVIRRRRTSAAAISCPDGIACTPKQRVQAPKQRVQAPQERVPGKYTGQAAGLPALTIGKYHDNPDISPP